MNVTKNGIPIATRPQVRNGNTFKTIPNTIKKYATLTRVENFHPVWLITPLFWREINLLKKEGWLLKEEWSVPDED